MTTTESLAAAELAYQTAPTATNEPARLARLAAVRQAVADGWTHAAIAAAMGKSRGWVSQRATAPTIDRAEHQRVQRAAAQSMADQGYYVTCQGKRYEPMTEVSAVRPRAIDRFRKD